jgi:hypothetical protein
MSSTPPEVLAAPLSLTGLLDGALRRLRQHVRAVYLPFAVPLALIAGAQPLVQLELTPGMYGQHADPSTFLRQMAIIYGLLFVMGMLYGLTYVAMVIAATDALAGRPLSPGRAWLTALDPRMLGTQLLVWLACLAGCVCCILPGIYAVLVLSVVAAVAAEERRYGLGALWRSVTLMQHNPRGDLGADPRLRSLLLIVAGTLIGWASSFIVQLPFTMIMMFLVFRSAASGHAPNPEQMMREMLWLQAPAGMLGALVQTVMLLYMAFGNALLYFDIRQRKEGQDLFAEAERLAQGEAPAGR